MIIYTNRLIPSGFDAITLLFVILIRPNKRDDPQLIAHEKVHVRQFWRSWGTFHIRYLLDENYRFECEVEAYKMSILHGEIPEDAAKYLMKYKAGLTHGEAMTLLKGKK